MHNIMLADGVFDFLSIDPSTIVFVWINTLIMFLIVRFLLFKPVNKLLDDRKKEVEQTYENADAKFAEAKKLEEKYTVMMTEAKEESADIIKAASQKAQSRSDEIIGQAKSEAELLKSRAGDEIEREKRRAKSEIKNEISEIAVMVAEKVIGKEINAADQTRLIDEFIGNVGDLS